MTTYLTTLEIAVKLFQGNGKRRKSDHNSNGSKNYVAHKTTPSQSESIGELRRFFREMSFGKNQYVRHGAAISAKELILFMSARYDVSQLQREYLLRLYGLPYLYTK